MDTDEAGFCSGCHAGAGVAPEDTAGVAELHTAVGQINGDCGDGGAAIGVRSGEPDAGGESQRAGRAGSFCGRRRGSRSSWELRPRGDGDNEISLLFPNGSRIVGLPGSEATIRGFSAVSLLLVDEAARVSDDLYKAIRPMLAVSGGSLWLMSTPFGRRGFFWDAWANGGPDWERSARAGDGMPADTGRVSGRGTEEHGEPVVPGRNTCVNSKMR